MTQNKKQIEFQWKSTADLIPYARNARKHSEQQVTQIASSIREFGFLAPVIIDKDNTIIAGHGRILAAQKLGLDKIPCVQASHLTDAQRRAYTIADNKIALNSEWDEEMLKVEIEDLKLEDFDLNLTGFKLEEIEDFDITDSKEKESPGDEENGYTKKIEAPIYSPKLESKPDVKELVDLAKMNELLQEIDSSDVPEEEKQFLRLAAQRHAVFDYSMIAEYYCHSSKSVQNLMEKSALVIIDFNKAIENSFVEMSKDLCEAYLDGKQ